MVEISAQMIKELRTRTNAGVMDCKEALKEAGGDMEQAVDFLRKKGLATALKRAGRETSEGLIHSYIHTGGKMGALVEVNCETDFVSKQDNFHAFAAHAAERALAEKAADAQTLAGLACSEADSETLDERRRALVATIGENITLRRAAYMPRRGDHLGMYVHQGARIGVLVDLAGGSDELARDIAMHVAAVNPQFVDQDSVPAAFVEKEKGILIAQAESSGKPPEIIEKMIQGRLNKFLAEVSLMGQPFVKDPDQTVARLLAAAGATVNGFVRYEVGEGIEKKVEDFAAEVASQLKS